MEAMVVNQSRLLGELFARQVEMSASVFRSLSRQANMFASAYSPVIDGVWQSASKIGRAKDAEGALSEWTSMLVSLPAANLAIVTDSFGWAYDLTGVAIGVVPKKG